VLPRVCVLCSHGRRNPKGARDVSVMGGSQATAILSDAVGTAARHSDARTRYRSIGVGASSAARATGLKSDVAFANGG
jgi:hypothetical protein